MKAMPQVSFLLYRCVKETMDVRYVTDASYIALHSPLSICTVKSRAYEYETWKLTLVALTHEKQRQEHHWEVKANHAIC